MFNVTRTVPAPASLANGRSYRENDVMAELGRIFHNKCYICEIKEPTSTNVEHFDSNGERFDWNNLFFACQRCNSIFKRVGYNDLLDCTEPSIDVVRAVKHKPPFSPNSEVLIEAQIQNANSTADLIRRTFNEDDTGNKFLTKKFVRKKVFQIYAEFMFYINKYIDEKTPQPMKDEAKIYIEHYLRCEQEYSAFNRWIILDDPQLMDEFGHLII